MRTPLAAKAGSFAKHREELAAEEGFAIHSGLLYVFLTVTNSTYS
jgi:hypothetical protein